MILLIVLILLVAALTGTLGGVLEIAAGVAVGLFLFVAGMVLLAYWFARRRWRQIARDGQARWERGGYPERSYRDY
jgi:Kef-type K+ transport system membrane component KefB